MAWDCDLAQVASCVLLNAPKEIACKGRWKFCRGLVGDARSFYISCVSGVCIKMEIRDACITGVLGTVSVMPS